MIEKCEDCTDGTDKLLQNVLEKEAVDLEVTVIAEDIKEVLLLFGRMDMTVKHAQRGMELLFMD